MGVAGKVQAKARLIPKDAPRAPASGRTGRTPATPEANRPSEGRITTNQSVTAASGVPRPADLLWLYRTVGNFAVSRMITAQSAGRRASNAPIQRRVVLQQADGPETPIEQVEMLRNWLARFSITLERQPLRLLRFYAMHEAEGVFTYPWYLAGGNDARQFMGDLDGIVPFPGAEFTVPDQLAATAPFSFIPQNYLKATAYAK